MLVPFYLKFSKNIKFAHLNINSVRHKFMPLSSILNKSMIDILSIQETKLDDSFPLAQFAVPGYCQYRKDCRSNSGGLLLFIRDDIPQRRLMSFEVDVNTPGRIETIAVEIILNKEKWNICSMYKQPKVKNEVIVSELSDLFENFMSGANAIIFGDLNVNMLSDNNCLNSVCEMYGMTNIVKSPTCFKGDKPTLIDVVFTNVPKRFQPVDCIDVELSDFHNMVFWATKIYAPVKQERIVLYRSYKKFRESDYLHDLSLAPFHVSEIFDDVNDSYWFCEHLLKDVIDKHVPLKCRKVRHNGVPYMNNELRKAINVKNILRCEKYKSKQNWEKYKTQRNMAKGLR